MHSPAPQNFAVPTRAPVVLQVVPSMITGGVERGTVQIGTGLVAAGWRALVASSGGPMVHELERAGVTHVTLPLASKNPLVIRANIRRLADLITRESVDIIHARSRAPGWSAYYAAQRTRRHFITTFHNVYGGGTRLKRHYNSVMAKGERVIAISNFVARHAIESYHVPPDRVRVIHRGVDLNRFDPAAVHYSRLVNLIQAWNLADDIPVIMLPGRVTRWKGHLDLLDAVALMQHRDIQLVFVGDDRQHVDFCRELLARAERIGLSGRVHFVGDCKDMPAAYMLADAVVSASNRPEGFGRVAVEAQAMERPLIATDHGGSQETIIRGETAWLVPPGDHGAMAQAIDQALSLDAASRIRLGQHARAAMARFDVGMMVAGTLAVYDELLFGSPPISPTPILPSPSLEAMPDSLRFLGPEGVGASSR